jgi:hypothetical protein
MARRIYTRQLGEQPPTAGEAGRLGRHVRHDPRSKCFPFLADQIPELKTVRHRRVIPVLDQLDIGSCTGNAMEGALGSGLFMDTIPDEHSRKPTGDPTLDESQAVQLYSEATILDDFLGTFPPVDTGSSGLAVAKAAKEAGLISGYTHCFDLLSTLKAITIQPVITGITWYDSFDSPDSSGLVSIGRYAEPRGGHEVVLDEINVQARLLGATNSWGMSWGLKGRLYFFWDDFERLLGEDGDVTVPVPLDQPSPEPVTPSNNLGCLTALLSPFMGKL